MAEERRSEGQQKGHTWLILSGSQVCFTLSGSCEKTFSHEYFHAHSGTHAPPSCWGVLPLCYQHISLLSGCLFLPKPLEILWLLYSEISLNQPLWTYSKTAQHNFMHELTRGPWESLIFCPQQTTKIKLFSNSIFTHLSSPITGPIKLFAYPDNYYILSIGEGLKNHHVGSISVQAPTTSQLLVSYYVHTLDGTEAGGPFTVELHIFKECNLFKWLCSFFSILTPTWPFSRISAVLWVRRMRCREERFSLLIPSFFYADITQHCLTFICWHITRN